MRVLLTGVAGFIGAHVARALLERGDTVTGLDNLSTYYSAELKQSRLAFLEPFGRFDFHRIDIADRAGMEALEAGLGEFDAIVHLAAQAGVRHSLKAPFDYVDANVTGQVAMLELAARRSLPVLYASSSSVYGGNEKTPFHEADRVDQPVSLYAATKRAGELIAQSYRATYGVRAAGLRFFTVYGRFGRPDMAPWLFTEAILAGKPITVFDGGEMVRDFTHVSDIVAGTIAALDRLVSRPQDTAPVYNLGNDRPVRLLDFIATIEQALGRTAEKRFAPRPPGDVTATWADIQLARRDLGYEPRTRIEDGMADFVKWFRERNG